MAVRPGAKASDTSGKYVLNRSLSTPHDDLLAAQGVSWLHRTAISIASVLHPYNDWTDRVGHT